MEFAGLPLTIDRAYIVMRDCDTEGAFGDRNCTVQVWVLDLNERRYLGEVSWPEDDRRMFALAPIPGTSCLVEQSLHVRWDPQENGPPALRLRVLDSRYQPLWLADYPILKIPNERLPHIPAAVFVREGKSGIVQLGSGRIEVRCTGRALPIVIQPRGEDGAWTEVEHFPKG